MKFMAWLKNSIEIYLPKRKKNICPPKFDWLFIKTVFNNEKWKNTKIYQKVNWFKMWYNSTSVSSGNFLLEAMQIPKLLDAQPHYSKWCSIS
jgi:hypothetical protein